MENAEFATVDRAVIRMSLAGLMSGNIEVQSIEVERPAITLERRDGGDGNWVFSPSESVVNSDMLRKVRLDCELRTRKRTTPWHCGWRRRGCSTRST